MGNMVQYGVWSNCCNACDFCLREERIPYTRKRQFEMLELIKHNINYVDWKNQFDCGISLLGGELYYITDEELQNSFLELIDIIITYGFEEDEMNLAFIFNVFGAVIINNINNNLKNKSLDKGWKICEECGERFEIKNIKNTTQECCDECRKKLRKEQKRLWAKNNRKK